MICADLKKIYKPINMRNAVQVDTAHNYDSGDTQ